MALSSGTRLQRYEILSPLGAGGMGEVYRARDLALGREVAVKVLPEHLSSDAELRSRFEREARAVAALSHPNILAIYDFGDEGGVSFAVTELLAGSTLRARLSADRKFPAAEAVRIACDVAAGLGASHASAIIHRDLKPENIFLTQDGRTKILDFGLARHDADPCSNESSQAPTAAPLTRTGMVMGTVGYMAPEQVRGARAEAASDIFSLGCVLYEMLSGVPAFPGSTASDVLAATLRDEPVPPDRRAPEIPAGLAAVVVRCLAKDPAHRWSSAGELAQALAASLGTGARPTVNAPPPTAGRDSTRAIAVLPLRNAAGDPEAEYLAEGIAESLIDGLARVPRIRVLARTTALRLGPDADPRRIGAELSVGAVLSGRVARKESSLAVGVELVDASGGWRLWGQDFQAAADHLPEIEREIVSAVSHALGVDDAAETSAAPARRSEAREAYLLDLKGRYNWNKSSVPGIRKAIEFFEQAIDVDPVYAPAYAGLSDCYAALGMDRYAAMSPRDSIPRAKVAARKALEIDDTLDQAHTSLGYAHLLDLDWTAAGKALARAVELNPERARARHFYGFYLATQARFAESEEQFVEALEIDPLSLIIHADLGWSYYCAREYDRARKQLERTAELDPEFPQTYLWLGLTCNEVGDGPGAIDAFEKALELTHGSTTMLGGLAFANARAGNFERVRELTAQIEQARADGKYVTNVCMLKASLAIGDLEAALDWLERSFEQRASYLVALKVYPFLDPLRNSPRFRSLLERSGLAG